jgi:formylglycine-generating enzyme required for sulfatase activity
MLLCLALCLIWSLAALPAYAETKHSESLTLLELGDGYSGRLNNALQPAMNAMSPATAQLAPNNLQQSPIHPSHVPDMNALVGPMVDIPSGVFRMGDLDGSGSVSERPVHRVSIKRFWLAAYDVTFEQYDAYAHATDRPLPDDRGWGRAKRPVINVSAEDAQMYIEWLNHRTGGRFRLPSEAEWEYAARSGATAAYYWGGEFDDHRANNNHASTTEVGSFRPNAWGLYDMSGNVSQWTRDCWNGNYNGAPGNGSAWQTGETTPCYWNVIRGGSWEFDSTNLRTSARLRCLLTTGLADLGFRLAQDR